MKTIATLIVAAVASLTLTVHEAEAQVYGQTQSWSSSYSQSWGSSWGYDQNGYYNNGYQNEQASNSYSQNNYGYTPGYGNYNYGASVANSYAQSTGYSNGYSPYAGAYTNNYATFGQSTDYNRWYNWGG